MTGESRLLLAAAVAASLPCLAQTAPDAATIEAWRIMARGSSLVAKATVLRDTSRFVVDPRTKPGGRIQRPDGTWSYRLLPVQRYALGTLSELRIDNVLKSDGRRRPGDVIDLYIPGPYGGFSADQNWLVFLLYPLELTGLERGRDGDKGWPELAGLIVEDISRNAVGPVPPKPFESDKAYSPAWASLKPAYLQVTPENAALVDAISADLALGDFQVFLATPRDGSVLTGVVELTAGSLGREMYGVQYQLDGVDLGPEVVQPPYRLSWDTATADEGRYELRAIGRDATGALATSRPVSVEVRRSLRISGASAPEGPGPQFLDFAVQLDAPASQPVSVWYTATGGTAEPDVDFVAHSGWLTFAPGETAKTIRIEIIADSVAEPDETVIVRLDSPSNAILLQAEAQGTIVNDDLVIRIGDTAVSEGQAGTVAAQLAVHLSSASQSVVTVTFATADGTATAAGNDYVPVTGTLTFNPGETAKVLSVAVNGDTVPEADESFVVNLSAASGGASISDAEGRVVILNDDGVLPLGVSPSCVVSSGGRGVTVTVAGAPGNPGDWVGVFASGASNSAYQDWWYLNGSQAAPGSGLVNTSFGATLPAAVGAYEFRLFSQTIGYVATSNGEPYHVVLRARTVSGAIGARRD